MPENLETKVVALKEEMTAAKTEAQAAKAATEALQQQLAEKDEQIKKANEAIDNLDQTAKEQKAALDEMKAKLAAVRKNWKEDFREGLEAKRADINAALARKDANFVVTVELKGAGNVTTASITPNNILGVDLDPNIVAAVPMANAFIAVLGIRPRRGNKIAWLEGSSQSGADYIAELAQNTNKSDVTVAEKTRAFGKIGTFMTISSEIESWFDRVYDFCVNEGSRLIDAKLDEEIYSGAGADVTNPTKIYGLKSAGQSTPYAPLGAVAMANAADVLINARKIAAKNGYNATVAFVSFAIEAALVGIKTTSGTPLYNQYTGMMNGLRIIPTSRCADGEALVMDVNCAEIYGGTAFELEFERLAAVDGYNVYFRRAAQVKVPAPRKPGIIFIADMDTAIASLDAGADVTLTLSDDTKEIVKGAGNAYKIAATVDPEGVPVVWTSSDIAVATVAQDGTVTGVAAGTAVILAEAKGAKAFCIVTVTDE